eukprot:5960803-Pleurochrysis_carterae.AAC.1
MTARGKACHAERATNKAIQNADSSVWNNSPWLAPTTKQTAKAKDGLGRHQQGQKVVKVFNGRAEGLRLLPCQLTICEHKNMACYYC